MTRQILQPLHIALVAGLLAGTALAETPARKPAITVEPKHPGTSQYTDYLPQPPERVRDEVRKVAANGSFISRTLLMISRDGTSKNFETITGQDGLTFGITDFATDGGISEFTKGFDAAYHKDFIEIFGNDHAKNLLDPAWVKANNAGGHGSQANDKGLIKFAWVRTGLDKLLTNPKYYKFQLENFARGKVTPSVTRFEKENFKLEFTLATMIGVANSRGAGGMSADLTKAIANASGSGLEREKNIARLLLRNYVKNDPNGTAQDEKMLAIGFGEKPGTLSDSGLGHRGRRAYAIFKKFPFDGNVKFKELGKYSL